MTLIHKRLLSLGVLLAVGGVAVWGIFLTDQRRAADEEQSAADKKVLAFTDATSARQLQLSGKHGDLTLMHEAGADGRASWVLVEPLRTPAEQTTVEGILQALATLSRTSKVEGEGAQDLGLFGLKPPELIVTVKDAAGKVEVLHAGKKNSFDGSLYVKRPDDAYVSLVGGSLQYQLEKDSFELRKKVLVEVEASAVQKLSVTLGGRLAYTVEKRADEIYEVTAPARFQADSVQVSGILAALNNLTAKSFPSEAPLPEDMVRLGLHKPIVKVSVDYGAGRRGQEIVIGEVKDSAGTHVYATVLGGGPAIELGSDYALAKLRVAAESLRDKHIAAFDRQQVASLTLTKDGKTLSFTRSAGPDGETWKMTAPEQQKAQDAALAGLVYRLWSLKAKRIVEEQADAKGLAGAGLDAPVAKLELFRADGSRLGGVAFGKVLEGEQLVSGDMKRLDAIDKSFLEELSVLPADYAEEATAKAP